jgi:hypothetical protein
METVAYVLKVATYCVVVYIGWLIFDYAISNWKKGGK